MMILDGYKKKKTRDCGSKTEEPPPFVDKDEDKIFVLCLSFRFVPSLGFFMTVYGMFQRTTARMFLQKLRIPPKQDWYLIAPCHGMYLTRSMAASIRQWLISFA